MAGGRGEGTEEVKEWEGVEREMLLLSLMGDERICPCASEVGVGVGVGEGAEPDDRFVRSQRRRNEKAWILSS